MRSNGISNDVLDVGVRDKLVQRALLCTFRAPPWNNIIKQERMNNRCKHNNTINKDIKDVRT